MATFNSNSFKIATAIAFVLLSFVLANEARAVSTFIIPQGGTGTTTAPASQLLYGSGGSGSSQSYQSVATTSVSCTGSATCTGFTVIGTSPIVINSSGGAGGSFPFSADNNYNQVVYSTSTPTLWFKSGLFASSTSYFVNASTTLLSATNLYSSSLTSGNCVQASTNGLLTTSASPCGTGSGGSSDPFTHLTYGGQTFSASSTGLMLTGSPLSLLATQASTTLFSAGAAWFGATATSSFATDGKLTLISPLLVTSGGTGLASLTQGDLIYGSAANTFSALAKDANSTRYLSNTGGSNNPAWAQVALGTGVSGTLPIANGGTATATQVTNGVNYFDNTEITSNVYKLSFDGTNLGIASTTPGSLLSIGTLGWNFTTATSSSFATGGLNIHAGCYAINGVCIGAGAGSGSVTSVALTVPTFLSISGSPITTSGTLAVTLSGTALPLANGGTATTTWTNNGGVVFYNSTLGTLSQSINQGNFFWDETNKRLAVGTTSPQTLLDLSASSAGTNLLNASGAMGQIVNTNTTNNNFADLGFATVDTAGRTTTVAKLTAIFTSHASAAISSALAFFTTNAGSAAEWMRLTNTGSLGIGTTTPWGTLSLHGTTANHTDGSPIFVIASSTASATTTLVTVVGALTTTTLQVGSSAPGCIPIKDTAGGGTTYVYAKGGVLFASTVACN